MKKKGVVIKAVVAAVALACAIVGSSVLWAMPRQGHEQDTATETPVEVETPNQDVAASGHFDEQSSDPDPAPALTPEPDPDPEPEPEPTPEFFTVAMMGDCTLGSDHGAGGNAYSFMSVVGDDYAYPFSMVKHLYEDADFVIVNLECALTDHNVPQAKRFRFRGPPEYVNILLEGGVSFAALGNNHSMDYGQRGYEDTQEILRANGVGFAPDGGWSLYETDSGLKIGVYSKNFPNETHVVNAVAELREAGAELIIMALHWGNEGSYRATGTQKQVGRAAIDAGAHIIMGTHPHTLQETEAYNGGYIYYSLANWTFGGNTNPRDKDSVIAKVTVMRDLDGEISVVGSENIPCSVSGSATINDYRPVPYEVDSDGYNRVLSKLDGSFAGPDMVPSYTETPPEDPEDDGEPNGPDASGEPGEPGESDESGEPDESDNLGEPDESGNLGEPDGSGELGELGEPDDSGESSEPGESD